MSSSDTASSTLAVPLLGERFRSTIEESSSSSVDECELEQHSSTTTNTRIVWRGRNILVIAVGMVVGILVQLSTLVLNLALADMSERQHQHQHDHQQQPKLQDSSLCLSSSTRTLLLFCSGIWSIAAVVLALALLMVLRRRGVRIFQPLFRGTQEEFDDIVSSMECLFFAGAIFGGWLGWTIVDLYLGLLYQALYSLAILLVCIAWMWATSQSSSATATATTRTLSQSDNNETNSSEFTVMIV